VKAVKPIHGTFAGCRRCEAFSFGSIRIDGVTYEHDVLIDRGHVRKRKKKPSKNSGRLSATCRFRRRKRSRGNADG
jgi:hypothetical protein